MQQSGERSMWCTDDTTRNSCSGFATVRWTFASCCDSRTECHEACMHFRMRPFYNLWHNTVTATRRVGAAALAQVTHLHTNDLRRSSLSYRSVCSLLSASSVLSIASAASLLSIGSFASILSIGSSNSVLSIGSDGGFLTIGASRRSRQLGAPARRRDWERSGRVADLT